MPKRAATAILAPAPAEHEPAGTVIAEGVIPGRAVAWTAPTVTRTGGCVPSRGYRRYQQWQQLVNLTACTQRPRRKTWPFRGPVELRLRFVLAKRGGRANPDTSNLTKSFEDALQGSIYENDSQVARVVAERVFSATEPEHVAYQVIAL